MIGYMVLAIVASAVLIYSFGVLAYQVSSAISSGRPVGEMQDPLIDVYGVIYREWSWGRWSWRLEAYIYSMGFSGPADVYIFCPPDSYTYSRHIPMYIYPGINALHESIPPAPSCRVTVYASGELYSGLATYR